MRYWAERMIFLLSLQKSCLPYQGASLHKQAGELRLRMREHTSTLICILLKLCQCCSLFSLPWGFQLLMYCFPSFYQVMHKLFLHSRVVSDVPLFSLRVGNEDAALLVRKWVGCLTPASAKGEKPHLGQWHRQLFRVFERVLSFTCVQNLNAALHWQV